VSEIIHAALDHKKLSTSRPAESRAPDRPGRWGRLLPAVRSRFRCCGHDNLLVWPQRKYLGCPLSIHTPRGRPTMVAFRNQAALIQTPVAHQPKRKK